MSLVTLYGSGLDYYCHTIWLGDDLQSDMAIPVSSFFVNSRWIVSERNTANEE